MKILNTTRILKMARSYLVARILGKPAPISTLINLTNQCPKGCCYCDSWKELPRHMPTEKVLTLLHEIRDAGVVRVTFHGGDPLMHPDFGIIIKEARKCGFFITVSVRETLVAKMIDELKYADLLFVSFDGRQKAHDAHKGRGSFAELMDVFGLLKKRGIPFQTTTVVTKLSMKDIDFVADTAEKYGFQAHFQTLQFTPNRHSKRSELMDPKKNPLAPLILSGKEYADVGRKLLKLKKTSNNIATSETIIRMIFLDWPDHAQTFLPKRLYKSIRCWSGLLYNQISVEGDLFPCSYYGPFFHDGRLPNVFRLGYRKALEMKVKDNSCQACQVPCYMELNAMFSLNLKTILNWAPKVL
ncbi:MAG: radical SAM protein [archaeon]